MGMLAYPFMVYPRHKSNIYELFWIHYANTWLFIFLFLDDDDVFLPGAIENVRQEMELRCLPVMFKMKHPGGLLWREMVVTPGNVGGSMICIPNRPAKYGRWPEGNGTHATDIDFINENIKGFDGLIWSDKAIVEVAPNDV